jgi:hypothetical protein
MRPEVLALLPGRLPGAWHARPSGGHGAAARIDGVLIAPAVPGRPATATRIRYTPHLTGTPLARRLLISAVRCLPERQT